MRSRSLLQQPGWMPGANRGRGGAGREKDNPKMLLERWWDSARRRRAGSQGSPMAGNAEGGGEMFRAAHIPWGGMLRGFPSWSWSVCGRGKPCVPSAWKSALTRLLECLLHCFVAIASAVTGQAVDHCTGGFLKWPLGKKLNLLRPDAAEELDAGGGLGHLV